MGNVYIDLAEDKIYIWDSASSTYISQSWNQSIITSIQTQITSLQNSKLNIPGALGHGQIGYWYNLYGNINNFMSSGMYVYGSNIGVGKENPEEKLDVNGNVKALKLLPNYYTYTSSFTKIEAINPTTKERALIDIPVVQNNILRNLQSNNINYCGFAPFGSSESAAVWTVTKITVAANGTATKQTFTNVTWSSVPL